MIGGLALVLLASCEKKYTPKEFYNHVQNQQGEFFTQTAVGEITYKVQHRPKEFISLLHLKGEEITQEKLDSVMELSEEGINLNIKISADSKTKNILKHNLQTEEEYFKRLEYFSNGFGRDVYLVNAQDTLYAKGHHFINIQCYFGSEVLINKTTHLVIHDRVFTPSKPITIPLPETIRNNKSYTIKIDNK